MGRPNPSLATKFSGANGDRENIIFPHFSCSADHEQHNWQPCRVGPYSADFHICVFFPLFLDVRLVDVPAGVTQEEGHTGFLIHLPSAVLALIFLARRFQPFVSIVNREVEFCVLTI